MRQLALTAAIVGIIAALAVVGNADVQEAEMQQARYCEMVAAWEESNGRYGWPPYQGECDDDRQNKGAQL